MTVDAGVLDIIELAYQAAVEPQLWPRVLEAVADSVGGQGSIIFYPGSEPLTDVVAARMDPEASRLYFAGFKDINPIQAATSLAARRHELQPVTTDQTWLAKDELTGSDFYGHFMHEFDFHAVLMVQLDVEHDRPTFNVLRSRRAEEFDEHEIKVGSALQQPLSRAWRQGQRLAVKRRMNEGLADLAERSVGAVMLVDGRGGILHANGAATVLLAASDGLYARADGLHAATSEASRRLAKLIGQATAAEPGPDRGGALSAPRPSGKRPLAVLVSPVSAERSSPGSSARLALISVVDPERSVIAPVNRLIQLFGLTPGEARVTAELVAGYEPKAIAEHLGVSLNTVRFHLARTMDKTLTSRQSDLVLLIYRTLQGSV